MSVSKLIGWSDIYMDLEACIHFQTLLFSAIKVQLYVRWELIVYDRMRRVSMEYRIYNRRRDRLCLLFGEIRFSQRFLASTKQKTKCMDE